MASRTRRGSLSCDIGSGYLEGRWTNSKPPARRSGGRGRRGGRAAGHGQPQPQRVRVRHLERGVAGYVEDAVAAATVDVAEATAVRLELRDRVSEGAAGDPFVGDEALAE